MRHTLHSHRNRDNPMVILVDPKNNATELARITVVFFLQLRRKTQYTQNKILLALFISIPQTISLFMKSISRIESSCKENKSLFNPLLFGKKRLIFTLKLDFIYITHRVAEGSAYVYNKLKGVLMQGHPKKYSTLSSTTGAGTGTSGASASAGAGTPPTTTSSTPALIR